jgi:hypothetical protein
VIFDTIGVRIELEAAAFTKDPDAKPLSQHRGKTTGAHLVQHAGNITKEKQATVKTVDLARNWRVDSECPSHVLSMGQEQFIDIPRIIITCFVEEPPEYCPSVHATVFMQGIKPHNASLFRENNYEIPMLIAIVVGE